MAIFDFGFSIFDRNFGGGIDRQSKIRNQK